MWSFFFSFFLINKVTVVFILWIPTPDILTGLNGNTKAQRRPLNSQTGAAALTLLPVIVGSATIN